MVAVPRARPQTGQGSFIFRGLQVLTKTLQVYSFVPIPGAQQHKRPRRRYEEIERMYKCGWNGCEKAYGTLNHLNAHVTMQSHGQKRTPEGKDPPQFIVAGFVGGSQTARGRGPGGHIHMKCNLSRSTWQLEFGSPPKLVV